MSGSSSESKGKPLHSVLTLSEPLELEPLLRISSERPDDESIVLKAAPKAPDQLLGESSPMRWLADPIPDVTDLWCKENLLTELERNVYENRFTDPAARKDWLLGRICAKEAVRELLFGTCDVLVPIREIEIRTAEDGSPQVHFVGAVESHPEISNILNNPLLISITHSRGRAYVFAVPKNEMTLGVGIDCELLREVEPGMTELVFESEQRQYINSQSTESEKNKAFFRLWTAREAFLKATNSSDKNPFEQLWASTNEVIIAKRNNHVVPIMTLLHEGYMVAFCMVGQPYSF